MANADGSVIFSCDLDSTKAQKKLSKLRDEISELNSKLEKETGNKLNLEKQLDAASQAAKATEERVKMLRKEVERLNDREWIQKQGFTQNEYQTQVLDRRAAAEAELKQQEALLHTQTKEVKTLSAAYEETTANIDSMTVKLDKAKVAAGELIANTEQERREREAENSALAKAGQYAARFRDQVKSLARSMLVFSVITAALMALRKQIKAAIATSAEASDAFARLKGALLTLAAPLMDVLIPALTWLMNLLAAIVSEIVTVSQRRAWRHRAKTSTKKLPPLTRPARRQRKRQTRSRRSMRSTNSARQRPLAAVAAEHPPLRRTLILTKAP